MYLIDLISFNLKKFEIWKINNIFKFDLSYFSSFKKIQSVGLFGE